MNRDAGDAAPLADVVIDIRNGGFGYGHGVVARADLQIARAEIVALLGPNGSGKTTVMKGMLGLVERVHGDVRLFGAPLSSIRDRNRIGYVPQRQSAAGPIPVTVEELVRSGRLGRRGLLHRHTAADRSAVAAAIDAVDLTPLATRSVTALSGGQQRRALVARALAGGAEVLLLDEPFAGVDQDNQHALADALAALIPSGITIVVVLHELGPLESLITRAVCMDSGVVAFDGPIASAPQRLLHLGHDHDPHGGAPDRHGLGLIGR